MCSLIAFHCYKPDQKVGLYRARPVTMAYRNTSPHRWRTLLKLARRLLGFRYAEELREVQEVRFH